MGAHNGNDTSVLHQVLRHVVDNNIIHGYQRSATPEQAAQHNEMVAVIREQVLAGDDVDSEAEFLEEDDFDFYRLQGSTRPTCLMEGECRLSMKWVFRQLMM